MRTISNFFERSDRDAILLGLSQRADHPSSQLHLLHGSLFDVKCTDFYCNYVEQNFTDPIAPALAIPTGFPEPVSFGGTPAGAHAVQPLHRSLQGLKFTDRAPTELDIADDRVRIPQLAVEDLPHCPKCKTGLLRPGVVWFGETLPTKTLTKIDEFIGEPKKIDLILVIGTRAKVYPAADYVNQARAKGARVAVINMDKEDTPGGRYGLQDGDWFFEGDAGVIIPQILKSEIGNISKSSA